MAGLGHKLGYENRPSSIESSIHEISSIDLFDSSSFEVAMFGMNTIDRRIDMTYPAATIRASSISLPSFPEIKFLDRHPIFKEHYIDGVGISGEVSITWIEDRYLSVFNYHRAWADCWYDRTADAWKTGPTGKKRNALITIATPYDKDAHGDLKPFIVVGDSGQWNKRDWKGNILHYIALEGLTPGNVKGLTLDWSNTSTLIHSVSYKVDRVVYGFNYEAAPSHIGIGANRIDLLPNSPSTLFKSSKPYSGVDFTSRSINDLVGPVDGPRAGNPDGLFLF